MRHSHSASGVRPTGALGLVDLPKHANVASANNTADMLTHRHANTSTMVITDQTDAFCCLVYCTSLVSQPRIALFLVTLLVVCVEKIEIGPEIAHTRTHLC